MTLEKSLELRGQNERHDILAHDLALEWCDASEESYSSVSEGEEDSTLHKPTPDPHLCRYQVIKGAFIVTSAQDEIPVSQGCQQNAASQP